VRTDQSLRTLKVKVADRSKRPSSGSGEAGRFQQNYGNKDHRLLALHSVHFELMLRALPDVEHGRLLGCFWRRHSVLTNRQSTTFQLASGNRLYQV
jgi:hypothetical protein